MARKGLGKGLDSLISNEYTSNVEKETVENRKSTNVSTKNNQNVEKNGENSESGIREAQFLPIRKIERNLEQPRQIFDEEQLSELAESIKQYGVLQPLLVKPSGDHYIIVAGERRWRAARMAGLKEVPVIIKDYTETEIMEISLIENIQREDLNVIEEARAYQRLLTDFSYRQEDLAKKLSRSRTAITNRIRLLKLCEKVQQMVIDGKLSEGHARTLLSLETEEQQVEAAESVIAQSLSVRETEKLVKRLLNPPKESPEKERMLDNQFIYDKLQEDMQNYMGTKVSIQRKDNSKGKIVIDYYSSDELERIVELFRKGSFENR